LKYKGELAIAFSALLFAINSILVKIISTNFSGSFISLLRFIIGIILGYFFLRFSHVPIKVYDKKSWTLRGLFGALGMITMYVSISMTSSGRATLLSNTYPIFVAIFGFLFFKESISIFSISSLVLCICGASFILWDGSHYAKLGDAIALISGITGGLAIIYLKKGSAVDHPIIIYLSTCIFGLILFPFTLNEWKNLTFQSFLLIVLNSTIAFIAQAFMTYGYRYTTAVKGSIISYFGIPLTLIFSYFFVGEVFKPKFFAGIILILAGLFLTIFNAKDIKPLIKTKNRSSHL